MGDIGFNECMVSCDCQHGAVSGFEVFWGDMNITGLLTNTGRRWLVSQIEELLIEGPDYMADAKRHKEYGMDVN